MGTPSEEDSSFVTSDKVLAYVNSFPEQKKIDLATLYPAAGEDALDLLRRILVFNPYFRITVEEALNHKFLSEVRTQSSEVLAPSIIEIEFEREGKSLSLERLKELFAVEVALYTL